MRVVSAARSYDGPSLLGSHQRCPSTPAILLAIATNCELYLSETVGVNVVKHAESGRPTGLVARRLTEKYDFCELPTKASGRDLSIELTAGDDDGVGNLTGGSLYSRCSIAARRS